MRIDLALQGIQLTLPPLGLLQHDLFHQHINLLVRILDRMPQMPDFPGTADINFRLLSGLVFHHRIIQFQDRA